MLSQAPLTHAFPTAQAMLNHAAGGIVSGSKADGLVESRTMVPAGSSTTRTPPSQSEVFFFGWRLLVIMPHEKWWAHARPCMAAGTSLIVMHEGRKTRQIHACL